MCGRFVSPRTRDIERFFERKGTEPFQLEVTYNAVPSMLLPVVHMVDGKLVYEPMQWGLIPTWWKKDELPKGTINARSEDAAAKPMWRSAVKSTRALVPAMGYYEWKPTGGPKQPYFIRAAGADLMCVAGLWSPWRDVLTFAILTMDAAPGIAAIHNRMPVVLPQDAWKAWTDPELKDGAAAIQAAQGAAVKDFSFHPVSTYVNVPKNQGAQCIEPLIQ